MTLHSVKKSLFASTNHASLPFFLVFSPSLSLSPAYFPRHARISRPSSSRSGSTSFMKYPLLNICNRQGNRDFRARASARRRPSSLAHVRMCACVCVCARVHTCHIWRSRLCSIFHVRAPVFSREEIDRRALFISRLFLQKFQISHSSAKITNFFFSISLSFSFFFFFSPCLSY